MKANRKEIKKVFSVLKKIKHNLFRGVCFTMEIIEERLYYLISNNKIEIKNTWKSSHFIKNQTLLEEPIELNIFVQPFPSSAILESKLASLGVSDISISVGKALEINAEGWKGSITNDVLKFRKINCVLVY